MFLYTIYDTVAEADWISGGAKICQKLRSRISKN